VPPGSHAMNRARLSFEASQAAKTASEGEIYRSEWKTYSKEFVGGVRCRNSEKICEFWGNLPAASLRFIGDSSLPVLLGYP
jgi:hypothetical protein